MGERRNAMRRTLALVAAAAVLTYFLDPANGRERRRRLRAWVRARWQRQLHEHGADPGTEPPPEVYAAAERLEEVIAAAAAPRASASPPPEESAALRRPTITVREPTQRASPVTDWDLPPAPDAVGGDRGGPRRAARPMLAAAAGAAAISVAVAVALVVWAVWPASGSSEPTTATQALVASQARAIALLSQPKVKRVALTGAHRRLVLVYAPNGSAILVATRLAAAPDGTTYRAWVTLGRTPQPSGRFLGGSTSVVVPLQHRVRRGSTVAVTVEPEDASDSPTSAPLFSARRP
jgi:Anti-sigma-K factor rskA